jgi:nicotinamide mononucleotide transporter
MSLIEIIATATGVLAVWLTIRQNPWCWPVGLVMVLLYTWIFYDSKLYSNMLLQLAYALLQGYGWWQWVYGGEATTGVKIGRLSASRLFQGISLGVIGGCGLGYLMSAYTDASAPWQDAFLSAFSLVAQWWMAQKRMECWLLWVVLDVLFVGLFLTQALYLTAFLYAVFTALAVRGWVVWRREYVVATA